MRRINVPVPARVTMGQHGLPAAVSWRHGVGGAASQRSAHVEHVIEIWHVDDDWWTGAPISRACYACQLDGGMRIVVVYDGYAKRWFVQR